uniref:Uncharacterized protein n=1 Tax=Oryza sativa subsp. japonica TaxID=39947 RepID=Q6H561_ORYSJ|nr:hypothetical protein [Oryza sativa Japonica Group]
MQAAVKRCWRGRWRNQPEWNGMRGVTLRRRGGRTEELVLLVDGASGSSSAWCCLPRCWRRRESKALVKESGPSVLRGAACLEATCTAAGGGFRR